MESHIVTTIALYFFALFWKFVIVAWRWFLQTETCSQASVKIYVIVLDWLLKLKLTFLQNILTSHFE